VKSLNELRDKAFTYAEKQGFHKKPVNLGERLMLVVSELSEALEADRKGKRWDGHITYDVGNGTLGLGTSMDVEPHLVKKEHYESDVRGTVEEELADAIIRICDIAGIYGIDLDWHVAAKMAYNETRPYKHGKNYG
jgi:NTP pyrophosphatase (non-canonical NTP hydrolase)